MEARLSANAYYEVTIAEPDPNRDFDSDIVEEPWQDIRTRMRPIPPTVLALSRLHEDRSARITADGVPAELAHSFARAMQPVAEECLLLAESVTSHDHYFVGTVVAVTAFTPGMLDVYRVDDDAHELLTMHIEEVDKGAPFRKNTRQRFAVANAAALLDPAAPRRSYWLRADTENGTTTYALARTISMIDDADRCPDPPADAGARADAAIDDDGCP
jgi:hypothetical protein